MKPVEKHDGPHHVLYDCDLLEEADSSLFDANALAGQGLLLGRTEGRGTTYFFLLEGQPCVLRHYHRGGLMAGLLGDRYVRSGISHSRAWREWHMLADLVRQQLPVPAPVAARVTTCGPFYRADLVTRRLEHTHSLAQALLEGGVSEAQWHAIGACIRRFHDAGVYHADLNARNILLGTRSHDPAGGVYLIDFDKGEKRDSDAGWQHSNLSRLRRSLDKLRGQYEPFHFDDADWSLLMAGWRA